MKILCLNLSISDDTTKTLLTHHIFVNSIKKNQLGKLESHDILFFAPEEENSLTWLKGYRDLHPHTWITLLVDKSSFKKVEWVNSLLKCPEKNEVVIKDHWETMLWFSLQKALDHKKNLELTEAFQQLSQTSETLISQLEHDISLATNIQRALLPKGSPGIPGVSFAVKYLPASGAGGDYYDLFEFGDKKRYGILLADSKSHGMAATLLSVLLKVRLEQMKDHSPDSASFVSFLNREIQSHHEKELASLSLMYGILDRTTLTFQYTVAGHLLPLLCRAGEATPLTTIRNPSLGGMDHFDFRENIISLRPGDLLVFHTDGLSSILPEDSMTTIQSLVKNQGHKADPQELQNDLMAQIDKYLSHNKLKDDVTILQMGIDDRALYVASK